jgi:rhodanese-related sulfurtransferase
MKYSLIYLLLFFISNAAVAQKSLDQVLRLFNSESIPYISVEELRMHQLRGDFTIFDSRELEEFEVSHIPSARYVGYKRFSLRAITSSIPDKDTHIVVYCSIGIRSETIGEKLKKAGYTNIHNLYGGIFEWKNKGYPVIDPEGKETENVHAYSKVWGKWLNKGVKVYD